MLTDGYQCPECGAVNWFRAYSMCDHCVLKFYYDNPNASPLGGDNE